MKIGMNISNGHRHRPSLQLLSSLSPPSSMSRTTARTRRMFSSKIRKTKRSNTSSFLGTMVMVAVVTLWSSGGNYYNGYYANSLSPVGVTMVDAMGPASEAAISALKTMDYRYFVAGGACAAFSHGITTPIDVVKTKIQADPKKYDGKGLIGSTIQICRDSKEDGGGPSALLQGLGPTILGYGLEGAMKFGTYEVAKPVFLALLGDTNKVVAFAMASLLAGAIAAVLLVPPESLRIKQVTQPASYSDESVVSGIQRIVREDGFFVMMSGVWAMLAKQVPYTFGKQVSFDLIAKYLYQISDKLSSLISDPNQLKWFVSLMSAFFASIVACLCSQPGDMILTETYNTHGNNNHNNKPGNFISVVKDIYKSNNNNTAGNRRGGNILNSVSRRMADDGGGGGGISEFFRGTKARIVHVGTIITSQLVVYDIVKQALGLPATGSH